MVWRYTEYSGCPYLTDWDNKKFKFGICLDEDTTEINPITIETLLGSINSLEFKTNGILRPRFYMRIGASSSSVFNLHLDRFSGLVRKICSYVPGTIEVEGLQGEFTELKEEKVDVGEFEDFKRIGEYAVKRFPFIADEITSSPYEFQDDIPEDEREEIETYFEKVSKFPSLELLQKDLSRDFYRDFTVYTISEIENDRLIRRKNPFTKEQLQELHKIVKPLKK